MKARIGRLSDEQKEHIATRLDELGGQFLSNNHRRLTAWVVGDESTTESAIRSHLSKQLPSTMIPNQFLFVDEIPRTLSGKVDRNALQKVHQRSHQQADVGDCSETELLLMSVCADVLGHSDFSLGDSFHGAGGDSLLCISFVAALDDKGVELVATDITRDRTLRDLALLASTRSGGGFPVEVFFQGDGHGTIVFASAYGESLWYRNRLEGQLNRSFSQIGVVVGSDSLGNQPQTLEAIAMAQVEQILRFDPIGPHVVLGFCWGGALGFEIARVLSEKVDRPPVLVLVETMANPIWYGPSRKELTLRFLGGLPLRCLLSFRKRGPKFIWNAVRRRLFTEADVPSKPSRESKWNTQQLRFIEMLENYRPSKWSGEMLLFRARSGAPLVGGIYADRKYGWQHLIHGGPKIEKVDGDHLSCLSGVAVQLNRILKALEESASIL